MLVIPWTAACQAFLSFTISLTLLKPMSIESVMASNYLILCCHFLVLPWIFPSIKVFSNESALCIRWPNYWSFSIIPSYKYPELISFRIDLLDLLVVQGTLKSLLQSHSLKASIFMFRDLFNNDNKKEFWSTAFLKANSQRRRFTFGRGCFHLDPFGTKHQPLSWHWRTWPYRHLL